MFKWNSGIPLPAFMRENVHQVNARYGPMVWCKKLKAFICMEKSDEDDTDSSETPSSGQDETVERRLIIRNQSGKAKTSEDAKRLANKAANSWKHLTRFLYGLFLVQILQLVISFETTWDPIETTVFFAVFGFSVGSGMAFSKAIRAIATLVIPVMCTSSGRAILMSYATMLILAGPVSNIAYNYGEISRSMICGNELGFNITKGLQPIIQEKKFQLLESLDGTIDVIVSAVEAVQETYEKVAKSFRVVADNIKKADDFVENAVVICDTEFSSYMCNLPGDAASRIRNVMTKPFSDALSIVRYLFFFNVHFEHEFTYKVESNKTLEEIEQKILGEVKDKFGYVTDVLALARFVSAVSTVLVILKATLYRKKYLTNSEFDNNFITDQFKHLDKKASRHGQVRILPLRYRESKKYISPKKCCMSRAEMKKCFRGWMMVSATMLLAMFIAATDSTLYTTMNTITTSLSLRSTTFVEDFVAATKRTTFIGKAADMFGAFISLNVVGKGLVAAIYRAVIGALQDVTRSQGFDINIDRCLPRPSMPNYYIYYMITCTLQLCYILVYIQAYMLRLRRYIMSRHYPERERQRIIYLRRKILNNRGIGNVEDLKRTIRNAANQVEKNRSTRILSFRGTFVKWSHRRGVVGSICRVITGRTAHSCSLCKYSGSRSEGDSFTKCRRMGCSLEYCVPCFDDLHRICPVCLLRHSKKTQKKRHPTTTRRHESISSDEREDHSDSDNDFLPSSGISDSSDEEVIADYSDLS